MTGVMLQVAEVVEMEFGAGESEAREAGGTGECGCGFGVGAIAQDSATVADATKSAANPNGVDVVYWIAPENGAKKAATPHVFHICQGVSPLNGKSVNHGSVTQAYGENATRITKQIPMEQKQCGFASSTPDKAVNTPAG